METMDGVRLAIAGTYLKLGVTAFTNRLWDVRETEKSKVILRF